MKFKIFTLHPDIFSSFISNSLIARAISKQIIQIKIVDWRQSFGIGNYKQVDDKPFGGGSGMVLMADPIINAMVSEGCFEGGCKDKAAKSTIEIGISEHKSLLPNNAKFYQQIKSGQLQTKKVNILMTPRGFPLTQQTVEWLAQDFEQVNILCGRYEGFDARINDHIDLELSIGNFVLNGGEVGSMCLVEAVSRLVPGFITKNTSVLHDSFSSGLNSYNEFEFANSKTQYQQELNRSKNLKNKGVENKLPLDKGLAAQADWGLKGDKSQYSLNDAGIKVENQINPVSSQQFITNEQKNINLFDNNYWLQKILPQIEHPQYTRPNIWQDPITDKQKKVYEVLLSGDHAKIQKWRVRWW